MDVFVGILDSMFSFQVSEFVGFFCLKSQEFVFRENFVVLGGFFEGLVVQNDSYVRSGA